MLKTAQTPSRPNGEESENLRLGEILKAVAQGETQALTLLYEQTRTSIYGFALSVTRNPADAEDVLQETYIRVWQSAPDYRENGKPLAWLFTIAKNLALMKLRAAGRFYELPEDAQEPAAAGPADTLEHRALLQAAFRLLGDDELRIVTLHAVSGFRHREIAALLGLPLSTVLSKYNRSVKKLKAFCEGETSYEKKHESH